MFAAKMWLLVCALTASLAVDAKVLPKDTTYLPKLISSIQVPKPAFVTFVPTFDGPANASLKHHLSVSSFNGAPLSKDYVNYYQNITKAELIANSSISHLLLSNTNLIWPNEATFSNFSLFHNDSFDKFGGLIVPGGFLVPTKSNGRLLYYRFLNQDRSNVTLEDPIVLSTVEKQQWFYHRVKLVDVNADGFTDLLTCRSYKPVVGTTLVQLVAFTFNSKTASYDENVISDDICDIFFDVADLDGDGRFEIVAAGYFISKLNIIYSNNRDNNFLVKSDLVVKTIDSQIGKLFDVHICDLDLAQDPKNENRKYPELLATNHQGTKDSPKGAVFYYKMTNGTSVRDAVWTRNNIYYGFTVNKTGIQQASPGVAKAFQPYLKPNTEPTEPPYIFVSGDGSTMAYIFKPVTSFEDGNEMKYEMIWSQVYKDDTVGGVSFADLDNDGYTELALAIYENNLVLIYSFQ